MAVSINMIVVKASILDAGFASKNHFVKYCAVRRFVKAHSMVYRMGTHQLQRHPDEVVEEAVDYMAVVRKLVVGLHCDSPFIMNLDQKTVYFSMDGNQTLNNAGAWTIHIRTSTNNTKRATVAVTICADGTLLPSVVVFKGTPLGQIAKTEFAAYSPNHQYHCQAAAWMDETVMIAWVDGPLKAHV